MSLFGCFARDSVGCAVLLVLLAPCGEVLGQQGWPNPPTQVHILPEHRSDPGGGNYLDPCSLLPTSRPTGHVVNVFVHGHGIDGLNSSDLQNQALQFFQGSVADAETRDRFGVVDSTLLAFHYESNYVGRKARQKSACRFKNYLKHLLECEPPVVLRLFAHSQGGYVTIEALKKLDKSLRPAPGTGGATGGSGGASGPVGGSIPGDPPGTPRLVVTFLSAALNPRDIQDALTVTSRIVANNYFNPYDKVLGSLSWSFDRGLSSDVGIRGLEKSWIKPYREHYPDPFGVMNCWKDCAQSFEQGTILVPAGQLSFPISVRWRDHGAAISDPAIYREFLDWSRDKQGR